MKKWWDDKVKIKTNEYRGERIKDEKLDNIEKLLKQPYDQATEDTLVQVLENSMKNANIMDPATNFATNGNWIMRNAIENGHIGIVEFLINKGYEINSRNFGYFGQDVSALHLAIHKRQPEIAKLLLKRGAIVEKFTEGENPIEQAFMEDYLELTIILLRKYNKPLTYGILESKISNAPRSKREGELHDLIVLYEKNSDCLNLHTAAIYGFEQTVGILLKLGDNPTTLKNGKKPSEVALVAKPSIKEKLVTAEKTWKGLGEKFTEALEVLKTGDLEKFKPLVVGLNQKYLNKLLYFAAAENQTAIAKFLLEKGADPDIKIKQDNQTPLHFATLHNNFELTSALIKKMTSLKIINSKTSKGKTALHFAVQNQNAPIVKLLLEKGAEFDNRIFANDESLIHVASALGDLRIVMLLIKYGGVNITKKNQEYTKPSSLTKQGSELCSLLYYVEEHGILPSLNVAAANTKPDTVKILLELGDDPTEIATGYDQRPSMYVGGDLQALLQNAELEWEAKISIQKAKLQEYKTNETLGRTAASTPQGKFRTTGTGSKIDTPTKPVTKGINSQLIEQIQMICFEEYKDEKTENDLVDLVKQCLDKASIKNKKTLDGSGTEIMRMAIIKGHIGIIKFLCDYGYDIDQDFDSISSRDNALFISIYQKKREIAKFLLERGANIDGNTLLQAAFHFQDVYLTVLLLKKNTHDSEHLIQLLFANTHEEDSELYKIASLIKDRGIEALTISAASRLNLTETVKALSEIEGNGTKVEPDDREKEATHIIEKSKNQATKTDLTLAKAKNLLKDPGKTTELEKVKTNGLLKQMLTICEETYDPQTEDGLVDEDGRVDLFQQCLNQASIYDKKTLDGHGAKIMQTAITNGHIGIVRLLCDYGYDIDQGYGSKSSTDNALYVSVFAQEAQMTKFLLDRGAKIDEETFKLASCDLIDVNLTVLLLKRNKYDSARLIDFLVANTKEEDFELYKIACLTKTHGLAALNLHNAAQLGLTETVKALLELGEDPLEVKQGKKPSDLVKEENKDLKNFLLKEEAKRFIKTGNLDEFKMLMHHFSDDQKYDLLVQATIDNQTAIVKYLAKELGVKYYPYSQHISKPNYPELTTTRFKSLAGERLVALLQIAILNGNYDLVSLFLENELPSGSYDISLFNGENAPAYLAAKIGRLDIALLLMKAYDFLIKSPAPSEFVPEDKKELKAVLKLAEENANKENTGLGEAPNLFSAAKNGWNETIQILLNLGDNPTIEDSEGKRPSHYVTDEKTRTLLIEAERKWEIDHPSTRKPQTSIHTNNRETPLIIQVDTDTLSNMSGITNSTTNTTASATQTNLKTSSASIVEKDTPEIKSESKKGFGLNFEAMLATSLMASASIIYLTQETDLLDDTTLLIETIAVATLLTILAGIATNLISSCCSVNDPTSSKNKDVVTLK